MRTLRTLRQAITAGSLASLMALSAADASAATVTAKFTGLGLGGSVNRIIDNSTTGTTGTQSGITSALFNFQRTGGDFAGTLLAGVSDNFLTICIEPQDTISIGSGYTFMVEDLSDGAENIGGMGVTKANRIRELLFGVNPFAFTTNTEGSALQIAIWEIVRETDSTPLDVSTGHTRFSNAAPAGALAQAQSWLNTYVNDGEDPGQRANNVLALVSDTNQDVLAFVSVPAPGVLPLFGLALAGIGFARRRKTA